MRKSFKKELQFTIAVVKAELTKTFLKYLIMRSDELKYNQDPNDFLLIKEIIRESYEHFPRSASLSRVQNICPFTGRTRGFYNFSKISRMQFKQLAGAGIIPGIRKASW